MPSVVRCSCGQSLRISDELMGKSVACPACGGVLTAGAPAGITAALPMPAPAAEPPPLPRSVAADDEALGEVLGVWIQLAMIVSGPNITVLTEHALCLGSLARDELKEAKRRLAAGASVPAVLGPAFRAIPLAVLRAVRLSNKDATVTLGYPEGPRRVQHTIQYCTPIQQWVFDALRQRLGRGWRAQEVIPATAWSASSLPVSVIGGLLFFTALCYLALLQKEGGLGPRTGKEKFMDVLIGWIPSVFCLGFAGVLLLAGAAWVVHAVRRRPPAVVTIVHPSESEPAA